MIFPICERKMTVRNHLGGFTFTEVVAASVILAVAIIPILRGLTISQFQNKIIENKVRSCVLAQSELDRIKVSSVYHYTNAFGQRDLSINGLYLCNIDDTSVGTNLRKIMVSVGYDSNKNAQLEDNEILVTLSTYIARRW